MARAGGDAEEWSAGGCVRPHLAVLRAVGFCGPAAPRRLHRAYRAFVLLLVCTYVLQQLVYAYQEMADMDKLSRVLFVLLCHVTCVAKQLVFHLDAARIDALIAGLDEPLLNGGERAGPAAAARARTARGAARLLRAYVGCAVATCALWTAFAVASRARGLPVELPFWTPFPYDTPPAFVLTLAYSFYATNVVAIGNPTVDAFIATVLSQCNTQLAVVRMCGLVERVFGTALLVQFTVGGWILCMAAYKIVSVSVASFEFASTALFTACILTELLLYCHYGNEVTVQSDLVTESLYCMDWPALPPRFRRALLVVMTRAQRPLRPAAGRVIPLTLHTYLTILKSSYSFYAVLRQTK